MATKTCPVCGGSGLKGGISGVMVNNENSCGNCGGSGSVTDYSSSDQGCFPGNSKVLTPNGWREIEKLQKGDKVTSINKSGELTTKLITRKMAHRPLNVVSVITDKTSFDVTPVHAIQTSNGWLRVSQLKIGDTLHRISDDGNIMQHTVKSIEDHGKVTPVFNLVVESNYTFIVDGCIAHSFSFFRKIRVALHELLRVSKPPFIIPSVKTTASH